MSVDICREELRQFNNSLTGYTVASRYSNERRFFFYHASYKKVTHLVVVSVFRVLQHFAICLSENLQCSLGVLTDIVAFRVK
jgi:hypothetical protein